MHVKSTPEAHSGVAWVPKSAACEQTEILYKSIQEPCVAWLGEERIA